MHEAQESQKIILSFLGTGNYQPCRYQYHGSVYETAYFAHALHHFYPDHHAKIVMTAAAKDKHQQQLHTLQHPPEATFVFDIIDIPDGKDEAELWDMFALLADALPANSRVIVDVTHGFRSQPMLALAAGVYLRTVKNVTIERIVYGAYEARDTHTNTAPVFDLTSFLDLIDWSVSAEQFIKYGNARPMSELLSDLHEESSAQLERDTTENLKDVGVKLARLSDDLAVNRPRAIVQRTQNLPETIAESSSALEHLSPTKPFGLLLEQVNTRITPLAAAAGDLFSAEGFAAQAEMLNIYLDTEQYAQAITLAREAIVSKVCQCYGHNPNRDSDRRKAEDILNDLAYDYDHFYTIPAENYSLAKLWSDVRSLRNDINHAGMRKDAKSSTDAIPEIKAVCRRTRTFITAQPKHLA